MDSPDLYTIKKGEKTARIAGLLYYEEEYMF